MQLQTSYMVNGIEWEGGEGARDWRVVVGQSWKYIDVSYGNGNARASGNRMGLDN